MKVGVIGAGIAGLVAARRLALEGHHVDLYERWPGLGGQVATMPIEGGDRLEHYYHHLFTTDQEIAALYEELGMGGEIEWLPSSMAIFRDGASHPFTSPLDLLRFRSMSPLGRLRMGAGALALQRTRGGVERFEGITARAMVERWMGPEAWRVVWGPLMEGKFAGRSEEISAAWLWNKLNLRRRIDGREAGGEQLGYPRGGWQPLLDRLAGEITGTGGEVLIDRPVSGLARGADGSGVEISFAGPGAWRSGTDPRDWEPAGTSTYDAVVATVPSPIFTALLDDGLQAELGDPYLGKVGAAEYGTAVCLLLELDRQFGDFYWTNIAEPRIPFIGLIEHGNLVGTERYGGRHFLYVANYVLVGDRLIGLGTDELLDVYEPGLRQVNPGFDRAWVREARVYREAAAQPIVTLGYERRIPALATPAPGLFLANTTQIYPEDRGTNYSVRLGEQAATAVG